MRRFTLVELAIGTALLGSLMAVAVPAFSRDLHASRFVEPTDGLVRLGASAIAHAEAAATDAPPFPETAPLTPSAPPRATKLADPIGTWDGATWKALAFRPSAEGVPHAYAFSFERTSGGNAFIAQARGDLDGDGLLSTFEIRGHARRPDAEKPALAPGMYVEAELE